MKIGILGSGDVGRRLGTGFAGLGHDVMIGSRSPDSSALKEWKTQTGAHASTGTFAETARFGEVLVLATLGTAVDDVISLAGKRNFAGKVLIDATNPLDFSGDGPPGLFVGWNDSLGERVQRWLPDARVVKAFNTAGNNLFIKPSLPGGPPDMFIGGNDESAKKLVAGFLRELGWGVVDLGGIETSRGLEPMCLVWVWYAIRSQSRDHAFKLLRK